jgi:hypothetical protein
MIVMNIVMKESFNMPAIYECQGCNQLYIDPEEHQDICKGYNPNADIEVGYEEDE